MASLPSLDLVGPGRAGRALARGWVASGGILATVVARTESSARRAVSEIGAGVPSVLGQALPILGSHVVVLAVPDDALAEVARGLSGRVECRLAFHLSGALPAEEIEPLRGETRPIGSFHALRAFTGASDETFRGAFVAVEGDDEACEAGLAFCGPLGARGHRLASQVKPLYHAGATLAAGGAVALVSAAVRIWALADLPEGESRAALAELAEGAIRGAGARTIAEALTGPVARRDLKTVASHRRALAATPDLLRLYAILAEEILARTPERGGEDELRAILAC